MKDMLEKSDIQAVIIATPTSTHKDIAIDCLNAGKDVLIEKPMARTYLEAKQIVDAAKKNKRKLNGWNESQVQTRYDAAAAKFYKFK